MAIENKPISDKPISGKHTYHKICAHCHCEYTSTARSQKFCSPDCCKKHATKLRGQRKAYARDREFSLVLSKAYALAHAVANLVYPKPTDEDPNDPYELHHLDENPLNNDINNILWVKRSLHNKLHSHLAEVNTIDYLKIVKAKSDELGLPALRQKYIDDVLSDNFDKTACITIATTSRYTVSRK